jgi:hypothetical protein
MEHEELRYYIHRYMADMCKVAADFLGMEQMLQPSGFWRSSEKADMHAFLADLTSSSCRVYWQVGQLDKARALAQAQLAKQPRSAPWQAIQAFLTQEQRSAAVTASGGRERVAQVALQNLSLFQSFPGWLDQLVSQVVGRPVTLAIEGDQPADIATVFSSIKPHVEVYLVEADGSKVPFSWQERSSSATLSERSNDPGSKTITTTSSGSSSNKAACLPPAARFLPAEDIYEKYLLPGVGSSAQQIQARDPAGSSPATTATPHTTTNSSSKPGISSVRYRPATTPGSSSSGSAGDRPSPAAAGTVRDRGSSSRSAAAGGASSTTSSSRAPQAFRMPPGGTTSINLGNATVNMIPVDTLEALMQQCTGAGR